MLKNKNRKLVTKLIRYNFKCNINGKINFRYGHLLPSLFLSFNENVSFCILTGLPPSKDNQVGFHAHKKSLQEPFSGYCLG